MSPDKEYELMPLKPIKDLQSEIKKLTNIIAKRDSPQKEFAKALNASLETQKSVKSMLKKLNDVNSNLIKLNSVFENVEDADITEEPHPELLNRLQRVESQNKSITEMLQSMQDEMKRLSYFKERLPPGMPVVYHRTIK